MIWRLDCQLLFYSFFGILSYPPLGELTRFGCCSQEGRGGQAQAGDQSAATHRDSGAARPCRLHQCSSSEACNRAMVHPCSKGASLAASSSLSRASLPAPACRAVTCSSQVRLTLPVACKGAATLLRCTATGCRALMGVQAPSKC